MATRIYLPSSGTAPVTPSTWNFANQVNPLTFAGTLTKNDGSAMTSKTEATGTVSPIAKAMFRWVIGPLAAQTITGTIKGQMRGSESNAGANASLALAVKIIQPGGADRAVLLAQTAADSATAPNELVTTLTNSKFANASEVVAIPLTSQSATAGDYLVIEAGFRSATTTTRNIVLSYGNDSATDLPEDTTTTAANNPWVEFSQTLAFIFSRSYTESAGTNDPYGRIAGGKRAQTDTVGVPDAYGRIALTNRLAAELLGLADIVEITSSAPPGSAYDLGVIESLGQSEIYRRISAGQRAFTNTFGLTDPPLVRTAIIDRLLSAHLVGLADAYQRTAPAGRSFQDFAAAFEAQVSASVALRLVVDTGFGFTDVATLAKQGAFLLAIAEMVGALEAFTRQANAARSYTNSAGLTHTAFQRTALLDRLLSPHSLGLADATRAGGAANRQAAETFGVVDTVARRANTLRLAADVLALADAVAAVKAGAQLIAVAELLGLRGGSTLTTGLAAYYRFEGNLLDATTNGNNLSEVPGTVTYVAGKIGLAMTGSHAIIAGLNGLTLPNGAAPFTIAGWIKGAASDFSGSGGDVTLAEPQLITIRVSGGSGAGQTLTFDFGDDSLVAPLGSVPNGGWAHGALTWDGTTCRAYVNGSFADVLSPTSWTGAAVVLTFDPDGPDATNPLDEWAVYNRALTAYEIALLYNGGAAYDPTANPSGVERTVLGKRAFANSLGTADALTRSARYVLAVAEVFGLAEVPSFFKVTGSFVVVTPAAVPANHAGSLRLTYLGSNTAWTAGTTFVPSGISGVTYSAANVVSPTLADQLVQIRAELGVDPAGPIGTLTITCSDGTQGIIPVVPVGLALSPGAGGIDTTPTVTATGTGSVWQSTDSGVAELFTVSGGSGATISTTGRAGDTAATAVLTVGTAVGTLTVRDVTTGATATFSSVLTGIDNRTAPGIANTTRSLAGAANATRELTGRLPN